MVDFLELLDDEAIGLEELGVGFSLALVKLLNRAREGL